MARILVVDDEHLVADTLILILRQKGFEVRVAYSAKEALEDAHAFRPDLLLCDISMPGRSGIELMADFGREMPQCPVLVLTGHYASLGGVDEQSRKLPVPVRVLTKPCSPSDVLREAGEMLRSA